MTARRPLPGLLAVTAFALACLVLAVASPRALADENPVGKIVGAIIPVNNHGVSTEYIKTQMHTRPGRPYDEATVGEDVRRLLNTRLFAPDGVQVSTTVGTDGQVTVFVTVKELTTVVQEVIFTGSQHLNTTELLDLVRVRRGGPLNPAMNQLDAQTILNKLREDGRTYASVTLLEGGKAGDSRVVFQIVEGPVVRLRNIEFRGNREASSGRLRTVVVTTGSLIPNTVTFLTAKYNPQLIDEDRKRLETYYRNLGFLDMTVNEEVVPRADPSEVTVVYHIVEGKQYTIRNIKIEGNRTVPEGRLKKVTALKSGDRYDLSKATADETRINMLYGNKGFSVGVRHATVVVADQTNVVDVHYLVDEPGQQRDGGPPAPREPDRVGRIIIEGNTITDQRVIMNQLGIYPGQILQYPQLKAAEANLARLGIFDQDDPPQVSVVPNDFDSVYKDVRVRIKETRTGMVALSANVNSDAGVNGSITVNQRNFDILRVPTSLDDMLGGKAFRGGGQEMRVEAMPGTTYSRYAVTFREPYLGDTRFGLTESAYFFNRAYNEYSEERVGLRSTVDYRFLNNNIWRANFSTRIEDVGIKDIPTWATNAITDDAGHTTLLGLRTGVTRDTRDNFLLPTKGGVLDVGFEQVFGNFNYTFPIGTIEASQYFTLWQRKDGSGKQVLATRSQVSVEGGNAPVFERFYAGGYRSMRGFTFRGVGPYENELNVGGTFAFLNTVEYQIPLMANDKLYAVAFCDHGTVENSISSWTNYRVSVGAGLRIVIPAMGPLPIALDFAFPISKGPFDSKQVFSFYVGWFGGQ